MSHNVAIKAKPGVVADKFCRVVKQRPPHRRSLGSLAKQLLKRHDELPGLRPVVSSEEIIEAYFRCAITGAMTDRYHLNPAAIPTCINSSHRAVRRVCAAPGHRHADIDDTAWRKGWEAMQSDHPEVNVRVRGHHAKRADLYLVASGGVVSIEFKYVGTKDVRNVPAIAAQVGLHAKHHAEAILVLYSETPVSRESLDLLEQKARRSKVRILNPVGPPIEVARPR